MVVAMENALIAFLIAQINNAEITAAALDSAGTALQDKPAGTVCVFLRLLEKKAVLRRRIAWQLDAPALARAAEDSAIKTW
jgi:hypothetical protein